MAQRIQTLLIDDIDGSAACSTVKFSVNGKQYEIDLNDKHESQFHKALAPYIEKGRRVRTRRERVAVA